MTLLEIRQLFISLSGREDLAEDSTDGGTISYGKSLGADVYIDAGLKQLDLWCETDKSLSYFDTVRKAGAMTVDLPRCTGVEKVFRYDTENSEFVLVDYLSYPSLVQKQSPTVSETDLGLHIWSYYPTQQHDRLSIILMPAIDTDQQLKVYGYFNTPPLVYNNDTNYWSLAYPLTLVHAALYKLEGSYRNREGAKDWKALIDDVLDGLDKNAARIEAGPGPLIMGNER